MYCIVLMLAVLTDGKWKLAATYCNDIRYWHDAVDRPSTLQNARQEDSKHQSDSGKQVSSRPHMVPEVTAVCLLDIGHCSGHPQGCVDRQNLSPVPTLCCYGSLVWHKLRQVSATDMK